MELFLANDNKLTKIKDEYTILSILFAAKDQGGEVYIWKMIGQEKHLGEVRIESIRKMRKDFCIVPADGQGGLIEELMGNSSYIDLYIPSMASLLRCTVKQVDATFRYYLTIPEFVGQVERRKNLRLNIEGSSEVKLSFNKSAPPPRKMTQHFFKDCYDISSGGFSFYISKLEAKFFKLNDSVTMLEIKAGNITIKTSAEIIGIRDVEPDERNGLTYKAMRVSCRFPYIDQVSRKYLEKFIFERIKDELHVISK